MQTKDVADTMMILVHALIGDKMKAFIAGDLASIPVRVSMQGGMQPFPQMTEPGSTPHDLLSNFGRGRGGEGQRFGRNGRPGGGSNVFNRTRPRRSQRF